MLHQRALIKSVNLKKITISCALHLSISYCHRDEMRRRAEEEKKKKEEDDKEMKEEKEKKEAKLAKTEL